MKKAFIYKGIVCFLLLILLSIPLFSNLGYLPIELWDESRLAINAYEMHENNNFIVNYFEGQPDMWNTKPPLMIWCQVVWMKILGVGELALRLPSAFAGLFTCLALLFFLRRYLKEYWLGIFTVLILVTTKGYVGEHVTRTGDYDALLTLFMTLYCLSFFALLETKKNKYLYSFFLFLSLSVLTKGVAGLLFLPSLFLYLLWKREFTYLFRNRNTYIGIGIFLCLTSGYYLLREWQNPGYLSAVSENELGGRFLVTQVHFFPFYYYFSNLFKFQFLEWVFFVPFGLLIALKSKNQKIKKLVGFSFLLASVFFLIITSAKTRLFWYDAPIFPFLAIIVGVVINFIFNWLKDHPILNNKFKINAIPYLFILVLFLYPYITMYQAVNTKVYPHGYEIKHYLQSAVKEKKNMDNYFVIYDEYAPQNDFYVKLLNDQGSNIINLPWDKLEVGNRAIVDQVEVKEEIKKKYNFEILESKEKVDVYKIIAIK